jgi:hypothetical protein
MRWKETQLIKKFGNPVQNNRLFEAKWMEIWTVPAALEKAIPCLPTKIYINKLVRPHLEKTLQDLIAAKLHTEIVTYDGCFNIRTKRGSSGISSHAFGIAVDFNAQTNPFRGKVTWSERFLTVWRNNGWICGADWSDASKDGMHFQGDNFL